ncbi:hypothetical protein ACT6NV_03165 [Robiginitalea sp. IMCC44478]|uniref:hypothetical protein n=1 Tax=Robiginitalea sp. IMCC44478 TaxID=3459122 RepID=UPI004042ED36
MGTTEFHLAKWYLDFISDDGQVMIFYAAKLSFMHRTVYYSSMIHHHPDTGTDEASHFHKVELPVQNGESISWKNDKFNICAEWKSRSKPLHARLFEDSVGFVDWNCHQPLSDVEVEIKDTVLHGKGYAELLTLTTFPWNIPMSDLRWGRFHSDDHTMVWIELRNNKKDQWLWLNNERLSNSSIEDDHIVCVEKGLKLILDPKTNLEPEKKLVKVINKIIRYLPGFRRLMTSKFLRATNRKWRSHGALYKNDKLIANGQVIHEWVNFKDTEP